ncbi:hypothetical protein [Streptomyces sp. NPDC093094]|uniref:hypothetical protein n=1 Tax=Streptomyces sp. NPDC093094 TaxID=3366026 RepID=UPI0037F30363
MVTVKCGRCGLVGRVHGPGMRFCRRCGLMFGASDPPPRTNRWGWEELRWPLVVLVVGSVLYMITESGAG